MKCSYCLSEIEKGTGIMYVYKNGDISHYCSNACMTNQITMGRKINPKLVAKYMPAKKVKPGAKPEEKKVEKPQAAAKK